MNKYKAEAMAIAAVYIKLTAPKIDSIANTIVTASGPHWITSIDDETLTYEEGEELKTISLDECLWV